MEIKIFKIVNFIPKPTPTFLFFMRTFIFVFNRNTMSNIKKH